MKRTRGVLTRLYGNQNFKMHCIVYTRELICTTCNNRSVGSNLLQEYESLGLWWNGDEEVVGKGIQVECRGRRDKY